MRRSIQMYSVWATSLAWCRALNLQNMCVQWGPMPDLPPMFVPLVMLVRQGLEQVRQA